MTELRSRTMEAKKHFLQHVGAWKDWQHVKLDGRLNNTRISEKSVADASVGNSVKRRDFRPRIPQHSLSKEKSTVTILH